MDLLKYSPGQVVGIYTIVESIGNKKYRAKCNLCGEDNDVRTSYIARAKSCKKHCIQRKYSSGDIVGIFTVLHYIGPARYWTKCNNCGEEGVSQLSLMRINKHCMSCRYDDTVIEGISSSKHYLYSVWNSLLSRTLNPNADNYKYYGARGIRVYEPWIVGENGKTGFITFASDISRIIGLRPDMNSSLKNDYREEFGCTTFHLSRIDHNKSYLPDNVKWDHISDNIAEKNTRNATSDIDPCVAQEDAEKYTQAWKNQG